MVLHSTVGAPEVSEIAVLSSQSRGFSISSFLLQYLPLPSDRNALLLFFTPVSQEVIPKLHPHPKISLNDTAHIPPRASALLRTLSAHPLPPSPPLHSPSSNSSALTAP